MSGYNVNYYRDVDRGGDVMPNKGRYGAIYVTLIDYLTGLPYNATGGGGGGGGDASAANQTSVQGPIAAGTATATKSLMFGGTYRATLPTWTDLQQGGVTFGPNGQVLTSIIDIASGVRAIVLSGANDTTGTTGGLGVHSFGRLHDPVANVSVRARGNLKGAFIVGAPLTYASSSLTVGTTASTVAANTTRAVLEIINDTANDIWYNLSTAATATLGGGNVKIKAGGNRLWEGPSCPTNAVSLIASAAGTAITIYEA